MMTRQNELEDKQKFRNKRKELLDETIITLKAQSTIKYTLLKDENLGLYFIRRNKDKKTVEIGDKEQAEEYILFGLQENITDVLKLFK